MRPLRLEVAPHIKSTETIPKIMWSVVLCLIPAGVAGVYFYKFYSLLVIITSIVAAVITEAICQVLMKKPVTIFDGSAVLTGLLFAYNLPPTVPLYIPAIGSCFAIAIVKQLFGGLGNNFLNPALAARVFVMFAWPSELTRFVLDGVTQATPLGILKYSQQIEISIKALLIGNIAGCIGETCKIALLLGAIPLFIKRYITWHIPVTYIVTVYILTTIFTNQGLIHILSGGLILGAFFMATDMVTTPITKKGKIVFGLGCGLITVLIRLKGGFPEGVSFSILLMNALTPIIDRFIRK